MRSETGTTVIEHGKLITGTGSDAIDDATVIVTDGRIAFAGAVADAPPVDPAARRLDAVDSRAPRARIPTPRSPSDE